MTRGIYKKIKPLIFSLLLISICGISILNTDNRASAQTTQTPQQPSQQDLQGVLNFLQTGNSNSATANSNSQNLTNSQDVYAQQKAREVFVLQEIIKSYEAELNKTTNEQQREIITKQINANQTAVTQLQNTSVEDYKREIEIERTRRATQALELQEEEVTFDCPNIFPKFIGGDGAPIGEGLACIAAHISYFWILTTANNFLNLISSMFNEVLELTVVNMKTVLGLNNDTNIINTGWIVFRDITNILFIFVLIYAAIRTILFGTGDTGKTIATVIAVAVLINFSMFFTKVIIDISNTLSISFYQSMIEENGAVDKTNIIGQIVEKSSIASIVGYVKDQRQRATTPLNYTMIIKQSLIGTAFIIVLIGVLFVISIMLLGRVIILGFIIMTSSLAVGSFIWPQLKKDVFDKWFPALLGQSFFIPVFLLFLLLSIRFLKSFSIPGSTGGASLANLATTSGIADATQGTIQFVLVVGMLIASLKISADMASKAGSGAQKVTSLLGAGTLGLAAWGMRHTLGRAGKAINGLGDRLDSDTLRGVGKFAANRTYDLRAVPGMESLAGKGALGSVDSKNTFAARTETREKAYKAEVADHGKEYEKVGKFNAKEQVAVANHNERKTQLETLDKLSEREKLIAEEAQLKQQSAANPLDVTLKKQHLDALKKLNDHRANGQSDAAAIAARKNHEDKVNEHRKKYGDDTSVSAANQAAEDRVKAAKAEYIKKKSEGTDSEKEFAREQRLKESKAKTDMDKLLEGIKAQTAAAAAANNPKP